LKLNNNEKNLPAKKTESQLIATMKNKKYAETTLKSTQLNTVSITTIRAVYDSNFTS
jgi:hypothetical protein